MKNRYKISRTAFFLAAALLMGVLQVPFAGSVKVSAETAGDMVVSSNTVDGVTKDENIYNIRKPGVYEFSMEEGADYTTNVIQVRDTSDSGDVTILLDNVNIYPKYDVKYEVDFGAPALWIMENYTGNVTVIYKGDCTLKGQNRWSAINKFCRPGLQTGQLTVKPSGGRDDVLNLSGGYGIGNFNDESDESESYVCKYSWSENVTVEGGSIVGRMAGGGVKNYVIDGGNHEFDYIGSVDIKSGTVVAKNPFTNGVVTYEGGNFYCSTTQVPVVNPSGDSLQLVVLPAAAGLEGIRIDGAYSACSAGSNTNNQVYTYLTKADHVVTLVYDNGEQSYNVSFLGNKPIIEGGVQAVYPNWALLSIKNATVTGIPETVYYTGKRIYLTDVSVNLDGYELIQGQDYVITYGANNDSNKDEGTCGVTIKGINTFKDTISGRFKIVKKQAEELPDNDPSYSGWTDPYASSTTVPTASKKAEVTTEYPKSDKGSSSSSKTSEKQKTMKLSGVKCKKKSTKVTGKVSVEGATVSVKVGSKAYVNATVSGKTFKLKVKKLKKGTKIKIRVTKSGYKTLTKSYKVK
ncbi:MAG: hypothetical protein K6E84_00200 [Lachnospiraceae bacterium]|nr:hypothetical protein [Lachnospiraceae bacterium]